MASTRLGTLNSDSPLKPAPQLPLPEIDRRELTAFCAPDADRYAVLTRSLDRRGIRYETIPLQGARHLTLPAPKAGRLDGEFYRVTLVAHYDRVECTPGANDNSAAVFQLLAHWEEITDLAWRHRTQVLFTDKEELTGEAPATDQGSCLLARHLRRLGAENILFFVLDMCGIGDTPVWGRSLRKAGLIPGADSVSQAHRVMEGFLKRYTSGEDFGVNPMFSDDLGLLLGGYPALQLSLLPKQEAEQLARRCRPETLHTDPEAPARAREKLRDTLPASWRVNHTPGDTLHTLEPRAFDLIRRLLRDLARCRFPLQ